MLAAVLGARAGIGAAYCSVCWMAFGLRLLALLSPTLELLPTSDLACTSSARRRAALGMLTACSLRMLGVTLAARDAGGCEDGARKESAREDGARE